MSGRLVVEKEKWRIVAVHSATRDVEYWLEAASVNSMGEKYFHQLEQFRSDDRDGSPDPVNSLIYNVIQMLDRELRAKKEKMR